MKYILIILLTFCSMVMFASMFIGIKAYDLRINCDREWSWIIPHIQNEIIITGVINFFLLLGCIVAVVGMREDDKKDFTIGTRGKND